MVKLDEAGDAVYAVHIIDSLFRNGKINLTEYNNMLTPYMDVAPRKYGVWIKGKCSECGGSAPFWAMSTTYYRSKYCPKCGAIMDGRM